MLAADERPNFTGVWKADLSKSSFGPMTAPSRFERRVMHLDPDLQITTTQVTDRGEMKNEVKHFTDGRESTNSIRGAQVKSTLGWDGKALRIDSKLTIQGADIKTLERWTLSPDGKSLEVTSHITAPNGEVDLKLIFDKQQN